MKAANAAIRVIEVVDLKAHLNSLKKMLEVAMVAAIVAKATMMIYIIIIHCLRLFLLRLGAVHAFIQQHSRQQTTCATLFTTIKVIMFRHIFF